MRKSVLRQAFKDPILPVAQQQGEEKPACVVPDCRDAPVAEVHHTSRDCVRARLRLSQADSRHIYICGRHQVDREIQTWLGYPLWQGLLLFDESQN